MGYNVKAGDKVRITRYEHAAPIGTEVIVASVEEDEWGEATISYGWTLDGRERSWLASPDAIEPVDPRPEPVEDVVNRPSHYTFGKYEVLDVIEDWGLTYHLGNAVKYIARAGKKDPAKELEDLRKAEFYVKRRISLLEGEAEV